VNRLILVRHAHSASNAGDAVNGVPPGLGLSAEGREQARALGRDLAGEEIDLGVSSRLLRARETLELALEGRAIPLAVEPLLDEVGFGSFEGGLLADYRTWAWSSGPEVVGPGGGEARAAIAARIAAGLEALLERPEAVILAVSHGLPVRYVLDAAVGSVPVARPDQVPNASAHRLGRPDVERAAETLRRWAAAPSFSDPPFGG